MLKTTFEDYCKNNKFEEIELFMRKGEQLPYLLNEAEVSKHKLNGFKKITVFNGLTNTLKLSIEKISQSMVEQLLEQHDDGCGFNLQSVINSLVLKIGGLPAEVNGQDYYIFEGGDLVE